MDTQTIPFPRGTTGYNGTAIDTNNLMHPDWEGMRKVFPNTRGPNDYVYNGDTSVGGYQLPYRDSQEVRCILVRNGSGVTLRPGQLVTWLATYRGRRTGGGTTTSFGEAAGFVDDQLASGVVANDLFWLVVKGPVLTSTPLAGADWGTPTTGVLEGDVLYASSGATSGATTAGRITSHGVTWGDTSQGGLIGNAVGRAMTARATTATGGRTDAQAYILVDAALPFSY
jgi:hypothetical protein